MTAQIVNLTHGREFRQDGRPSEGNAYRPCWVLRISNGETVGGFRTPQTAEMAARRRGAEVVSEEPDGWKKAHK